MIEESKSFVVGGVELAVDDPILLKAAPEMLELLFEVARFAFAGNFFIAKRNTGVPAPGEDNRFAGWEQSEAQHHNRLGKKILDTLMTTTSGRIFKNEGGVQ